MSRVGKKPIPLPQGRQNQHRRAAAGRRAEGQADGADSGRASGSSRKTVTLNWSATTTSCAALHGLTRALAANAVQGVSTGFTRELDIVGTGYRADVKGKVATFTLGYSHPIELLSAERRRSEGR